ncbi:MAG: hypothetical protein ACI9VS_001771 [Candidatus Binatia bacterium]|jgi:hypothetical protein
MQAENYIRLQDRLTEGADRQARGALGLGRLAGVWVNTNVQSRGLTKLIVTASDGDLTIQAVGAVDGEERPWSEAKAESVYGDGVSSTEAIAFVARNDFGFMQTELHGNLAKGLLIVSTINDFPESDNRSNYFAREYYARRPQG